MANRRKKPAPNASPPKGKDAIKQHLLTTDPTKDYQFRRTNFWGETLIQGLPPWRLWTGRMMIESDPLVEFALNIRNAPLMAAEIDVITNNSQVKNWILKQWNTIWNHHREKVTAAKAFGFTAIQVDWEIKDGILDVKGLKDLAPEDSRCLQLDTRTVGWEVKGAKAYFPQACWLTFGSKYGNPYGRGCLRRQYPPWYEKWMEHGAKKLLQLRMIKDAYIGDIFWYPPDLLVQLPDGRTMPWKDVFRELAENRLSGGALVLPRLLDDNGKPLTDYTPPQDIGGGSQIFEWKDQCDKDILKGADIPIEVVEAQETGSGYSGRSVPFLTMLGTVNSEFSEIVHALDEAIFRPGVWLNFGNDVDYEIIPKNIVETFGDDTQGSPMGGEAIGGTSPQVMPNTNSQQQAPPQLPGNGVQFDETNGPFRHISTGRVGDKVRSSDGHFGHITGETKSHFHVEGETDNGNGKTYKWKRKVMKGSGKQRGTPTRTYVVHLEASQHEEAHSFSCLLFKLDDKLKLDVLTMSTYIPSQDLYGTSYGNETETGRELDPHVTLKYGIHTDDVEEVRKTIQGESPIAVQFGNTTCFYQEDHDVVKIEVESKQLHALNKTVCEKLECTDTYPEYKPHVTIAYVKKGLGDYYARRLQGLNGKVTVFDQVVFSNKERQHTNIPLTGSAQFREDKIPGGLADKKKPEDFDPESLAEGMKVESEHTSDESIAREIAMDHLTEDKDYYKKLKKMEGSQHTEHEGYTDVLLAHGYSRKSFKLNNWNKGKHQVSIYGNKRWGHRNNKNEQAGTSGDSYHSLHEHLTKVHGTSQHAEFESKERGTLHAPPGGVTIHGVKYEGGEFIPKEVLERLTPDERSQVEAGSVARHIKEKPELSSENGDKHKAIAKSSAEKTAKLFGLPPSKVEFHTDENNPNAYGEHGGETAHLVNVHTGKSINKSLNMYKQMDREVSEGEHIAAHEIVHQAYSKNSELGQEMRGRLKKVNAEFGSGVSMYGAMAGSFENLIELGAVFSHSPKALKSYSEEMYNLASEWIERLNDESGSSQSEHGGNDNLHRNGSKESGDSGLRSTGETGLQYLELQKLPETNKGEPFDSNGRRLHRNEGGIPSNGDTFQHSEEAERIQREFLNEGTAKLVEGAKDRLNALKQTSIENLAELHGLIQAEIFKLQPALEMALTASNFKHYVEGMAEIVREVPAEFLPAPTLEVIKTPRSEITEAIATPSPLPEAVAGIPPVKPPGITAISLPEPPPPKVAFPIHDDAIRVLEASPASVGANYRETAELVRQGSFAVTGELVQGQVEQIKEVFQTALEEGHSRDRFIDNVINTLGEGKLSESHLETVFRTNAMAVKSNSKHEALQMPLVSSAFPYVGYSATHDARTRPEHLELESDGLQGTNIYRADDPTFLLFRPPWSYNCRCTFYPVTVEQAAKKGVTEAVNWLERAKNLASMEGGSFYLYLKQVAPTSGEHVTPPGFAPEPEFKRA